MRIVGVMDRDTALGFLLAGIEVKEVDSPEEVIRHLTGLMSEKDVGLVLYGEAYQGLLPEPLLRHMERSEVPIYLPIPTMSTWKERERAHTYIGNLLRRAVGFQFRLK